VINLFDDKPKLDRSAITRIKAWTHELLALDDDATTTVAELRCAEPDCPDVETVVGILEVGNNRKIKIFKPVSEVDRADISAAVAALLNQAHQ